MIEEAKFTYFSLGKPFEKKIKPIEDEGEKEVKALRFKIEIKIDRRNFTRRL